VDPAVGMESGRSDPAFVLSLGVARRASPFLLEVSHGWSTGLQRAMDEADTDRVDFYAAARLDRSCDLATTDGPCDGCFKPASPPSRSKTFVTNARKLCDSSSEPPVYRIRTNITRQNHAHHLRKSISEEPVPWACGCFNGRGTLTEDSKSKARRCMSKEHGSTAQSGREGYHEEEAARNGCILG
jgi:hypothetical protein